MPSQRLSSASSLPFPSRAAARAACAAAVAGVWLVGCAGLLGIEEATCDPDIDPRCAGRTLSQLTPAGSGGSTAGAGGLAAAAGNGGDAGAAGGGMLELGGAGGASAPVEPPLCERYCDTIMSACTGENEQYASPMACRAVCGLLAPGSPGAFGENSVECRLARAELARATGEPASYCYTAGPGGGGVCGTDCEGFCTIMAQMCTLMGSFDECLPQCEQVPNLAEEDPDEAVTYGTAIQNGDSVQCRLYHVTAATLDSRTHCSHAAGVALCVDSDPF